MFEKIDPVMIKAIRDLRENGHNRDWIAHELGISGSTVSKYAKGIKQSAMNPRKFHRSYIENESENSDSEEKMIFDLRNQGYSIEAISREIEIPESQVEDVLSKYYRIDYPLDNRQSRDYIQGQILEIEKMRSELSFIRATNRQVEKNLYSRPQPKQQTYSILDEYEREWLAAEKKRLLTL